MRVLLGIGGSDVSWEALDETLDRAAQAGDALTVAIFENEEVDASREEIEARVREMLDSADLEAEIRHLTGHPGGALVEIADGEDFDRLVLGGGKRSPLGKIQIGSIAEFVVLNSETPVTLIR